MYLSFKRLFDIIFSSITILVLSPILVVIILLLKFTGEGEVFYLQARIGQFGKIFHIYKFATMIKDSPNIGSGIYTAKNDSRILPFGYILRLTKINELPQLFNIFLGNMSFIGPRPLIDKTYLLYSDKVREKIDLLKPGLSGIGSIVFRNEEEILSMSKISLEDFYAQNISPYKGALEVWYFANISFVVDVKIIFLTLWLVFFPSSEVVYKSFFNLPIKPKFL